MPGKNRETPEYGISAYTSDGEGNPEPLHPDQPPIRPEDFHRARARDRESAVGLRRTIEAMDMSDKPTEPPVMPEKLLFPSAPPEPELPPAFPEYVDGLTLDSSKQEIRPSARAPVIAARRQQKAGVLARFIRKMRYWFHQP